MSKFDNEARNKELKSLYKNLGRQQDEKVESIPLSAKKNGFSFRFIARIIGIIIMALSIITIGISILTTIACLGIGIIMMFIGFIIIWATMEYIC